MFQSPCPVISFPFKFIKMDPCRITSYENQPPFSDILGNSTAVTLPLAPSARFCLSMRKWGGGGGGGGEGGGSAGGGLRVGGPASTS